MTIIYCLHGDEIVTEEIAKQLNKDYGIKIILGNPKARKKEVRFIESDLNRSFGKTGTYEAERALALSEELKQINDDLTIDLHTTTANMPPIGIITSEEQLSLAGRLGIENLVLMNKKFSTGGSLIENVDNSISIEIHADSASVETAKKIILAGLNKEQKINSFNIYEVIDIINKEYVQKPVTNLVALEDGTYPIFYGEKSYKDIAYLKTRKKAITI